MLVGSRLGVESHANLSRPSVVAFQNKKPGKSNTVAGFNLAALNLPLPAALLESHVNGYQAAVICIHQPNRQRRFAPILGCELAQKRDRMMQHVDWRDLAKPRLGHAHDVIEIGKVQAHLAQPENT